MGWGLKPQKESRRPSIGPRDTIHHLASSSTWSLCSLIFVLRFVPHLEIDNIRHLLALRYLKREISLQIVPRPEGKMQAPINASFAILKRIPFQALRFKRTGRNDRHTMVYAIGTTRTNFHLVKTIYIGNRKRGRTYQKMSIKRQRGWPTEPSELTETKSMSTRTHNQK